MLEISSFLSRDCAFGGSKVAMSRGAEVYYLHGDHLGSTSLTTDSNGEKISEARYLPYGEERWPNDNSSVTDFGFTAQRKDSYIKLYDYGARWYDPLTGRFISPDTIIPDPTDSGSFNRYSYVNNNPVRYTDPSGHAGRLPPGMSPEPIIKIDVSNQPTWVKVAIDIGLTVATAGTNSPLRYDAEQQAIVSPSTFDLTIASMVSMGVPDVIAPELAPLGSAKSTTTKVNSQKVSGKNQNQSLDWSIVSKKGETRIEHVNKHGTNNINKPNHGVFYDDPIVTTQEAWNNAGNIKPISEGSVDFYHVPSPNAGWAGGKQGTGENLNYVTIITRKNSTELITSYPSAGPAAHGH